MMTKTSPISRRIAKLCALALIATAPLAMAGQSGYYRWKDDKGQFQATQQPPSDRPSEYIRLSTGKSTPVDAGQTVEAKEAGAAPAPQPAPAAGGENKKSMGPMQGLPDKNPEKCAEAQQTQGMLDNHARIREKDEKGEYRYLSPDEIAEQKRLAKEASDIYCEPAQ